jgi:hypothetical protein
MNISILSISIFAVLRFRESLHLISYGILPSTNLDARKHADAASGAEAM